MSDGSSTTQITLRSRRASWQLVHSGPSARLKHSRQLPMRSLTSRIASASASASSCEERRMKKARRWAVRWPTPGSRASCAIRLSTEGAYKLLAAPSEARQAETAQLAHHLLLLQLLRGRDGAVHG